MEQDIYDENLMKDEEVIASKCPNCGSELEFIAGTNTVKCIHCDSIFEIKSLGRGKLDSEETSYSSTINKLRSQNTQIELQRVIHCQDCGALIVLDKHTISTECPFCGSNRTIEEKKESEIVKINGVIPFKVTTNEVEGYFKNWIKRKVMAPFRILKGKLSPKFNGIYIPFYTFDSMTFSNYTARRGDYYYVTKTVRDKNGTHTVRERRIRWTPVRGTVRKDFDDIVVRGTSNSLNKEIDKIKNFDFNNMEKYNEQYLLGYYAERASLSLDNGFGLAKQEMMDVICSIARHQIGGDIVEDLNVRTNFDRVTFKQIMAPIYNGTYTYKNKKYHFVCNGQTGQVHGKAPVSALKVSLLVLLGLLVFALIFYLAYIDYIGG